MKKFYSISTNEFRPISHENVYLYGEYNKIKNFLISNNQEELLKVLSIPSFKNNQIDWSAITNNDVKKLEKFPKIQQEKILSQYHQFLKSYNTFIKVLRSSKHQDKKNWGELLHSLIEGSANELFYDGEHIFITWGWRLLDENSKKLIPVYNPNISKIENEPSEIDEEIVASEPIPVINEDVDEEVLDEEIEEERLSWLDRLYLFLNKLWWLIPTLSFIILVMLLFRSCKNQECIDLNNKINNIDILLDSCNCKESQDDIIAEDLDFRLERENGCSGAIQISLIWNNYNDLDLHCIDPKGEEIYFRRKRSSSGGELDIDMNASLSSIEPVENICWINTPPGGNYKIYLNYYKQKDRVQNTTDYMIRVKNKDKVKEFRGSISKRDGKIFIYQFNF